MNLLQAAKKHREAQHAFVSSGGDTDLVQPCAKAAAELDMAIKEAETYTEKQKETIRGAAMLIMAQLDYSAEYAAKQAVHKAKALVDELIEQGLCD